MLFRRIVSYSVLVLVSLSIYSCSEKVKETVAEPIIKNEFAIEYVGEKILEFNWSYTPPTGKPITQDTFELYKLVNRGMDTVWIKTLNYSDPQSISLKDSSIKTINKTAVIEKIVGVGWIEGVSECFGCGDSVRLYPSESLFFIMEHAEEPNFDSSRFNIIVKIKRQQKIIDSLVTKKIVFKKGHFVDDTNSWNYVHFQ